jgi:hypothetical protein
MSTLATRLRSRPRYLTKFNDLAQCNLDNAGKPGLVRPLRVAIGCEPDGSAASTRLVDALGTGGAAILLRHFHGQLRSTVKGMVAAVSGRVANSRREALTIVLFALRLLGMCRAVLRLPAEVRR